MRDSGFFKGKVRVEGISIEVIGVFIICYIVMMFRNIIVLCSILIFKMWVEYIYFWKYVFWGEKRKIKRLFFSDCRESGEKDTFLVFKIFLNLLEDFVLLVEESGLKRWEESIMDFVFLFILFIC